MSRSKNKSLSPVKVVVFLLGVVFVGAAVEGLLSAMGFGGVILLVVAGIIVLRFMRSVRRRFK